jgi:hypothetical protein
MIAKCSRDSNVVALPVLNAGPVMRALMRECVLYCCMSTRDRSERSSSGPFGRPFCSCGSRHRVRHSADRGARRHRRGVSDPGVGAPVA